MSTQEFIIKLIKLLKPEFYNKITQLVVISGLALIATPFWEEILLAALKKKYELDLAPGGNTFWGFALVVVGLFYHLTTNSLLQFIEYKDKEKTERDRVKHDSKVFMGSQDILSEKFLTNFFEQLLSDHSYRINDSSKLREYAEYHLFSENSYIDNEIQEAATEVSIAINRLLNWMSCNFWALPGKQTEENLRLCMHPHWNIDMSGTGEPDDSKKYSEATDELSTLSNEVKNSYKVYRGLIKNKLFI